MSAVRTAMERADKLMVSPTHRKAGPCGVRDIGGGRYVLARASAPLRRLPPMPAPHPSRRRKRPRIVETPVEARPGKALVWTDGACSGNPGPGGWAAIVVGPDGEAAAELSGGEPHTTNNRM